MFSSLQSLQLVESTLRNSPRPDNPSFSIFPNLISRSLETCPSGKHWPWLVQSPAFNSLCFSLDLGSVPNLPESPPIRVTTIHRHLGLPVQNSRHLKISAMPSFSNDIDISYQTATATATATHPRSFESPRKSHDKAPVGNTFLWTNWPNAHHSHGNGDTDQNDRHFLNDLKNGSAYSLNGSRPSVSPNSRDPPLSKDGSMNSLSNGSARDPRENGRSSATLDRKLSETGPGVVPTSSIPHQANGIPNGRPTLGKLAVNGDAGERPSADESISPSASLLQIPQPDETARQPPTLDRLTPDARPGPHRHSSPPAPSMLDAGPVPESQNSSMRHRHSLQVPRTPSVRRDSREYPDDTAYSTGRTSPTSGFRRTSMSLIRRATKSSTHQDITLDETAPDEDAALRAEAIIRRRASRRRHQEEDDEKVIVGTKVDQNHVNYVTAYNMLTGIRFTVSRINAKMDRELTPADFDAKHKFSFDM